MTGPGVPVPPADITEAMPAFLADLERLVEHVAEVRDTWRALAQQYTAWCETGGDEGGDWFVAAETATGMDRAGELAGVVQSLADLSLVPGGAIQVGPDEAETVVRTIRATDDFAAWEREIAGSR